jgi:hypothetical protein
LLLGSVEPNKWFSTGHPKPARESAGFVDKQHSEPRRLLLVRGNDLIGVERDVCFGTLPAATSQPIGWRRRFLSIRFRAFLRGQPTARFV